MQKFFLLNLKHFKDYYLATVYCTLGFVKNYFVNEDFYKTFKPDTDNYNFIDISNYIYTRYDNNDDRIVYYIKFTK